MPPLPSDAEPRPPEDFAPLLATKNPVLLVGEQAVNLWAIYYETRTAALAPFVSRDVDVLGDRETLKALGKLAGTKPQFFPVKPPTNEIGVVIAKDHNGLPLLIEVLRSVHGVSNGDGPTLGEGGWRGCPRGGASHNHANVAEKLGGCGDWCNCNHSAPPRAPEQLGIEAVDD